jgi:PHP family Zn ribbon phosphoesterase
MYRIGSKAFGGRVECSRVSNYGGFPCFYGRHRAVCGFHRRKFSSDKMVKMSFPIKTCAVCGEEFELKPDKPGFANRCPECSDPEAKPKQDKGHMSAEERKAEAEANAERRKAIRDLLYRKDR